MRQTMNRLAYQRKTTIYPLAKNAALAANMQNDKATWVVQLGIRANENGQAKQTRVQHNQ